MWLFVGLILAAGIPIAHGLLTYKKLIAATVNNGDDGNTEKFTLLHREATSLITSLDQFLPSRVLENKKQRLERLRAEIDTERSTLANIEDTLKSAQEEILQREARQQELKITKKEDINKIDEINAQFETIDDEYSKLNQSLRDSIADIEALISQLEGNEEVQQIFIELSKSLQASQAMLEELKDEYHAIKSRIDKLREQQASLEEEYAKLVEKQLG